MAKSVEESKQQLAEKDPQIKKLAEFMEIKAEERLEAIRIEFSTKLNASENFVESLTETQRIMTEKIAAYETDIANATMKNFELRNENKALTSKIAEIKSQFDAVTAAKKSFEASCQESNAKTEKMASDLTIKEGKVSDMFAQIDSLTYELKKSTKENQENERKIVEMEKLVAKKTDKIKSLECQLVETKERVSKLETNLAISEDNESDSFSDLRKANEKISTLKYELKHAVEHSEELNNELLRLRASKKHSKQSDDEIVKNSELRISALEAELENSHQTLVERNKSSDEFSKVITQLEIERNATRLEMLQMQAEKSSFESATNAMSNQFESLNAQISKLTEELEMKSNETVQLNQQLDDYSGLINETNTRVLLLEQQLKFSKKRISELEVQQLNSLDELKQTNQRLQSAAEMEAGLKAAQQDKEAIEARLNDLLQSTAELKDVFVAEGTSYKQKLASTEKELEYALSKLNAANEDLKNSVSSNSHATESCKQFDMQIKRLESEKQDLQNQLQHALEQGTITAKNLALSQNSYQFLETQLNSLNEEKLDALRKDIIEINVGRDTANQIIEQKSEEIKNQKQQIENLNLKLKESNDENVELSTSMQEAKNIIEVLTERVTAFENLISAKDLEILSLQNKINESHQVIRESSNKISELERALENSRVVESEYSEKLEKTAKKLEILLADYEEIKSQVLQQQQTIESLEDEKLAILETADEKDRKIKELSNSIAILEAKLEIGDRESATVELLTKKVGELSDILAKNDFTIKQFEEALILAQKLMDQRDQQISELCEASSVHKLHVNELEGKLSDAIDQIKKQLEDMDQSKKIFAEKETLLKSDKESLNKQIKERDARVLELESRLVIAKNQFDANGVEIELLKAEMLRITENNELADKLHTRIETLQQSEIELQKTLNDRQMNLSTAEAKILELERKLVVESDLLRKLRAEEVESHVQIAELTTEGYRMKQLLAEQSDVISSKELGIFELRDENSKLKGTISKISSEIKNLEDEKVKLVEAAAKTAKSISVLETELGDLKANQVEIEASRIAEITAKDAIISNLQLSVKELDGKIEFITSEKTTLTESTIQRDAVIAENKVELKSLTEERNTLSEQLDILQEEVDLLKSTVDDLQNSVEEKDSIVSELESRAQENDERNQTIQDTSINLARENKKLLQMKKAFEVNIRKLEKQLEAARSDGSVETNVPVHVEENQTTPKGSKRPAVSNNTSTGPSKVARTVEKPQETPAVLNGSNAVSATQGQAKYRRRTTMAAKKPDQAAENKDQCAQQ
ncbi:hypothetical protein HK100_009789 [Physocladia obscura]|uniref:Uncharacterized protein n=1 Tax=Physocladia obscura TaxID=109957 RepID=A0AAD5T3T8_9FUNG|nr:hypothetical protein HK100_009789 [Physocladia obscura]